MKIGPPDPKSNGGIIIAYYLEQFHQGDFDSAFHGLREQDHAILPELANRFRASTDQSLRVFLLNVIWQHRQPSVIALLAEALDDPVPEIWKEALDGLVALGGAESLSALRQAKSREFASEVEKQQFSDWLDEAIDQVQASLGS